jgi:hypothetical protein
VLRQQGIKSALFGKIGSVSDPVDEIGFDEFIPWKGDTTAAKTRYIANKAYQWMCEDCFAMVSIPCPHHPHTPSYQACLRAVDYSIGILRASGHTLIVITDNGGDVSMGADNSPWDGSKGEWDEGGVRGWGAVLAPHLTQDQHQIIPTQDLATAISRWHPLDIESLGRDSYTAQNGPGSSGYTIWSDGTKLIWGPQGEQMINLNQ